MTHKYEASESVIRRLPRFYRRLKELEQAGQEWTSSRELGEKLGMTPSQIRQDLNCFGCFGHQGYGYSVRELRESLEAIIGLPDLLPAIIVGAGSLGQVVSENVRFRYRGFELIGIFETKEDLIGKTMANLIIQDMKELETFCAEQHPVAAVLCLPMESAQVVAEQLAKLGIRGIWNFSHCDIEVEGVQIVTMHLDDSLMMLSYKLHNE